MAKEINEQTRRDIRELVYAFFAGECGVEQATLRDETNIVEDLEGDSLMLLSLLEQVRAKYGLTIALKTLGRHLMKKPANTVGAVVDLTLAVVQYGDDIVNVEFERVKEVLLGCGVDAERIDRFHHLLREERPWPLVFSPREIRHSRQCAQPAAALCAAFCCKEAFFKAVRETYNLTECEFFFSTLPDAADLVLSAALRAGRRLTRATAQLSQVTAGELCAAVYVLTEEPCETKR